MVLYFFESGGKKVVCKAIKLGNEINLCNVKIMRESEKKLSLIYYYVFVFYNTNFAFCQSVHFQAIIFATEYEL